VTPVFTSCVCGAQAGDGVSIKDGVAVVRCSQCGVLRTLTRDTDYLKTYTEGVDYHAGRCQEKYGYEPYAERFGHDYNIATQRITRYFRDYKSLDVGCANGAFVQAMADSGWQAYGLELNPAMAAWAADQTNRPVYDTWDQVEAMHDRSAFQLITYHDVFEHVIDPVAEFRIAHSMLTPHGRIVLDVPDGDEVFGPTARAAHHEKPEQHLWYWTEATLRKFVTDRHMKVLDVDRPIVGKLVVTVGR
jgi:2-polyprenyl-3-methyl-5-hydroxy-6-metoxy-1,4-benzoquinol methylase